MKPEDFIHQVDLLLRLPVPIVIDHMARINSVPELAPQVQRSITSLLRHSNAWLKLSGTYLASDKADDGSSDLDEFVWDLVQQAGDRLVWGSDWPHATESVKRDDAQLLDLLLRWAPTEAARNAVLVDNPQTLYQFN